jgi:hypothetical protein
MPPSDILSDGSPTIETLAAFYDALTQELNTLWLIRKMPPLFLLRIEPFFSVFHYSPPRCNWVITVFW